MYVSMKFYVVADILMYTIFLHYDFNSMEDFTSIFFFLKKIQNTNKDFIWIWQYFALNNDDGDNDVDDDGDDVVMVIFFLFFIIVLFNIVIGLICRFICVFNKVYTLTHTYIYTRRYTWRWLQFSMYTILLHYHFNSMEGFTSFYLFLFLKNISLLSITVLL